MRIAILDDQSEMLDIIENMIEEAVLPEQSDIAAFTDEKAFLQYLENEPTDIAIIDIMLGGDASGIDVAKQINRDCPQTCVIFISAGIDFVEDLYAAEHLQFLRKPLTPPRLIAAIEKACKQLGGETVAITRRGTVQHIRQDSIIMAESDGRNLLVYTSEAEPIKFMAKLDEFEKLLNPAVFLRCHKSYVVNMNHIAHMNGKEVRLKLGGAA